MKQKLKTLSYWTSIISIGIILGISLQFTKAWVAPTATPPTGNVGAPINTSGIGQIKSGNLQVNGLGISGTGSVLLVPNGNVGIGTTTPTQKLDVAGNIKGTQLCIGNDCRSAWPTAGTTYTAGTGISISGNTISATGGTVLSGTLCGLVVYEFGRSGPGHLISSCGGFNPDTSCPPGYIRVSVGGTDEYGISQNKSCAKI